MRRMFEVVRKTGGISSALQEQCGVVRQGWGKPIRSFKRHEIVKLSFTNVQYAQNSKHS